MVLLDAASTWSGLLDSSKLESLGSVSARKLGSRRLFEDEATKQPRTQRRSSIT